MVRDHKSESKIDDTIANITVIAKTSSDIHEALTSSDIQAEQMTETTNGM